MHTLRQWTKTFCDDPGPHRLGQHLQLCLAGSALGCPQALPGKRHGQTRDTVATPTCWSAVLVFTVTEGFNRGTDFKAFFLDDGVIAGKARAVQLFSATLEHLLREVGRTRRRWPQLVLPSRISRLTTLRGALGCPTATPSFWVLLPAPRNGVHVSSTGASRR